MWACKHTDTWSSGWNSQRWCSGAQVLFLYPLSQQQQQSTDSDDNGDECDSDETDKDDGGDDDDIKKPSSKTI